ncbi:MAG: LPS export ABC transporter periplasmic protein LptC [Enterobacteriaceae bacterium]
MSRYRLAVIILLTLLVLALIGWNLADISEKPQDIPLSADTPAYQSEHTDTRVYDPTGALQYRLIANDVKHYTDKEDSWFSQPVLTLFDKNALATWIIRANRAKLTQDQLLYLYGDVLVESQQDESQLKRIDTNSALVNLLTQDVSSQERVALQGTGFHSTGLKMRGNLRSKNAELIEKVKTTYEMQPH